MIIQHEKVYHLNRGLEPIPGRAGLKLDSTLVLTVTVKKAAGGDGFVPAVAMRSFSHHEVILRKAMSWPVDVISHT